MKIGERLIPHPLDDSLRIFVDWYKFVIRREMTLLAQSIYKTLAFFDAQDLPLTLFEIKGYLVNSKEPLFFFPSLLSLTKIQETLDAELSDKIDCQNGFCYLRGRAGLIKKRQRRYPVSLQRFRKARKFLAGLRYVPYLRAVAISGSLALLNCEENSDIDLFLIIKKNRIWISRLLVSLYFQVLGERRYEGHIKGRFCLNHYLSEDMEIRQDQNLYTATEYTSLLPVLGKDELMKFWQKNLWIGKFLLKPQPETSSVFFDFRFSFWQKAFEFILEFSIGPFLNWLSGQYQKKRIKMQEYILVSDEELSFHPSSRGQKVLAKFSENLGQD